MLKHLRLHVERFRQSLFFLPAISVALAIGLAQGAILLDGYLTARGVLHLPTLLQPSVESARALVSTIAAATITVAGVVFAVTLVSIQLAASQFSPRVIPHYLRDSWQQQVTGLAVGTFTYSLVVLAMLRAPGEANGSGVVPHVSGALALVLAVSTILALMAFLDRSALSMQVGEIIRRITVETRKRVTELYPDLTSAPAAPVPPAVAVPAGPGHAVRATEYGWVAHIDTDSLLTATPEGGTMRLDVRNGSFVAAGQTIAHVWPALADDAATTRAVNGALVLGATRQTLHDVAFGIRQLVDIALRALSPGVNDPTTAYEAIMHLGQILRDLLWRDLAPTERLTDDGRRLLSARDLTHADYVNRAFDQIRLAGGDQSAIVAALLQVLGGLSEDLAAHGLPDRADAVRHQAQLVLATYDASGPLAEDLTRVQRLATRTNTEPAPASDTV